MWHGDDNKAMTISLVLKLNYFCLMTGFKLTHQINKLFYFQCRPTKN